MKNKLRMENYLPLEWNPVSQPHLVDICSDVWLLGTSQSPFHLHFSVNVPVFLLLTNNNKPPELSVPCYTRKRNCKYEGNAVGLKSFHFIKVEIKKNSKMMDWEGNLILFCLDSGGTTSDSAADCNSGNKTDRRFAVCCLLSAKSLGDFN